MNVKGLHICERRYEPKAEGMFVIWFYPTAGESRTYDRGSVVEARTAHHGTLRRPCASLYMQIRLLRNLLQEGVTVLNTTSREVLTIDKVTN